MTGHSFEGRVLYVVIVDLESVAAPHRWVVEIPTDQDLSFD